MLPKSTARPSPYRNPHHVGDIVTAMPAVISLLIQSGSIAFAVTP